MTLDQLKAGYDIHQRINRMESDRKFFVTHFENAPYRMEDKKWWQGVSKSVIAKYDKKMVAEKKSLETALKKL